MASFQLAADNCEKIASPLAEWILPLVDKLHASNSIEQTGAVLEEANTAMDSPEFHMNVLLERQTQQQQKTILTIVNLLLEEIPHIFPTRNAARQFHDLIVSHLHASGVNKCVLPNELSDAPVGHTLDIPNTFNNMAVLAGRCPLDGLQNLSKTEPMQKILDGCGNSGNCVVMRMDAAEAMKSLEGLSENVPDVMLFMKKTRVRIGNRVLDNVEGRLKIHSGLRRT